MNGLREALELALYALNEIPNTKIRHDKYKNSYEVTAEIGKVLRRCQPDGRRYLLRQVPAVKGGINPHRTWYCEITGVVITSNEDVLGDKFYIDNGTGEDCDTEWFPSPTAAIKAYLKKREGNESR